MTDIPLIAQKAPYPVEVEGGKDLLLVRLRQVGQAAVLRWLAQGHQFNPVKYTAEASKKVFFCGCKHTAKAPLCDGTHNKL